MTVPDAGLQRAYRMPAGFGPAPGPRNVPTGVELPVGPERRTVVAWTVPVREAEVASLVPPGLALRAATLTVNVQTLDNLRWLAGRGYRIVSVTVPVRWRADGGEQAGEFLAVLWESMADPVLTGRDELGFPKLFADIEVSPFTAGDVMTARASWDATTFFTAQTDDLRAATPPSVPPLPVLTRRYLPGLGPASGAAVDELTITDHSVRPDVRIVETAAGVGEFEFSRVTWQQVPTQYPVINTLAAIRPLGPAAVLVSRAEGQFSAVWTVALKGAV